MNVAQPARRQAVDRRGADFRAEAAEVRIADIVEYNGDEIGRRAGASGRASRRHAAQRRRGEQGADETATGKGRGHVGTPDDNAVLVRRHILGTTKHYKDNNTPT